MMDSCVWKVLASDRLCGCCTLRGVCDVRFIPKNDAMDVGSKYIKIVKDVIGVNPLEKTRKREAVWGRNVVAYQLCIDGFIQKDIATVIGKNRVTVVHCIQMMNEALKSPNQYKWEYDIWQQFKERLSLNKKQ
jgi:hypothetical protein